MSDAARELEKSKMARFDEKSGNLYVTELGRVASHFYIKHSSIVMYNDLLKRHMSEAEVQQLQRTIGLKWSLIPCVQCSACDALPVIHAMMCL